MTDNTLGVPVNSINYNVYDDASGDLYKSGNFLNQNSPNAIIEFNDAGDYTIIADVLGSNFSNSIPFTVNPSLNEIETSEILPEYYLCDGDKQIDINIINTDPDLTYSIIVSSENTYPGSIEFTW